MVEEGAIFELSVIHILAAQVMKIPILTIYWTHIVRYNISPLEQVAGENNTAMYGLVSALGSISFKGIDKNLGIFTASQRSCGKVMFSGMSVRYSVHGGPHATITYDALDLTLQAP